MAFVTYEDIGVPVEEPGEPFEGTIEDYFRETYGVTEERLALAAARLGIAFSAIERNERQAAITSRNIILN